QYLFGLSSFEIAYLRSGLTMIGPNLDDVRPRPFSTLNSTHAYSCVMAFMMVLSGHFVAREGKRRNWRVVVIMLTYAVALLLSMGRGAIITGFGMIVFAKMFRSRIGIT